MLHITLRIQKLKDIRKYELVIFDVILTVHHR